MNKANNDTAKPIALRPSLKHWAQHGYNAEHKRFCEQFSLQGQAEFQAPLRSRVPSRQVYALGLALEQGLPLDGLNAAELKQRFLAFWAQSWGKTDGSDAAGFATLFNEQAQATDTRRLAYDHAFALLALAQLLKLAADKDLYQKLNQVWDFSIQHFSHPEQGFVPQALWQCPMAQQAPLLQNPNMHMFEACLALYAATQEPRFGDKATEILQLFKAHILAEDGYYVREYFQLDWTPTADTDQSVEPGHMLEWVALLARYEALLGRSSGVDLKRLFETALDMGQRADGLICNQVGTDGQIKDQGARCWPQTELVRAALVVEALGHKPRALASAQSAMDRLERLYLGQPFPQGWIDKIDPDGQVIETPVPASTLYHIVNAVFEYQQAQKTA